MQVSSGSHCKIDCVCSKEDTWLFALTASVLKFGWSHQKVKVNVKDFSCGTTDEKFWKQYQIIKCWGEFNPSEFNPAGSQARGALGTEDITGSIAVNSQTGRCHSVSHISGCQNGAALGPGSHFPPSPNYQDERQSENSRPSLLLSGQHSTDEDDEEEPQLINCYCIWALKRRTKNQSFSE